MITLLQLSYLCNYINIQIFAYWQNPRVPLDLTIKMTVTVKQLSLTSLDICHLKSASGVALSQVHMPWPTLINSVLLFTTPAKCGDKEQVD